MCSPAMASTCARPASRSAASSSSLMPPRAPVISAAAMPPVDARQHGADARRHALAQILHRLRHRAAPNAGGPRRQDHPRLAIGKAGGADGLEEQLAPDVARARLATAAAACPASPSGSASRPDGTPPPRNATRTRRGGASPKAPERTWSSTTRMPCRARLQADHAAGEVGDDGVIQHRRGDALLAQLGHAEAQQQRRQQAPPPPRMPTKRGDQPPAPRQLPAQPRPRPMPARPAARNKARRPRPAPPAATRASGLLPHARTLPQRDLPNPPALL